MLKLKVNNIDIEVEDALIKKLKVAIKKDMKATDVPEKIKIGRASCRERV